MASAATRSNYAAVKPYRQTIDVDAGVRPDNGRIVEGLTKNIDGQLKKDMWRLVVELFPLRRGEVAQVAFGITSHVTEITERERSVVRSLLNAEPLTMPVGRNGIMHPVDDFLMVAKAAMLEMMMLGKVTERYYYYVQMAFRKLTDVLETLPIVYSYRHDAQGYITETSRIVMGNNRPFEFHGSDDMVRSFLAFMRRALDWCSKFNEPPDMNGHGIEFRYPMRPPQIQQSTMGYFVRPKVSATVVADATAAAVNLRFSNQVGEVSVTVPPRERENPESGSSSGAWGTDPAPSKRKPVAHVYPFVVESRYGEGEMSENSEEDGDMVDGGEEDVLPIRNNDEMDYDSDATDITDHSSAWGEEPDEGRAVRAPSRGNDDLEEIQNPAARRGPAVVATRSGLGDNVEENEREGGPPNGVGRSDAGSVIVIDSSSDEDETFPVLVQLPRRIDPRALLSRIPRAAPRTRTRGATRPRSRSPRHRRGRRNSP